jgi:hypothetical protein
MASEVMSAFGDIAGGFSQQGASGLQAKIAKNNQTVAAQNAAYTAQAGEVEGEQAGLRNRAVSGTIRARQAAGGVDVNTGSAATVQGSAAELGAMDAMTIRSNAARAAYGYQVKGHEAELEYLQAKAAEKAAPIEGFISAGGTLLGGASSTASKYSQWQQSTGGDAGTMDATDALAVFG